MATENIDMIGGRGFGGFANGGDGLGGGLLLGLLLGRGGNLFGNEGYNRNNYSHGECITQSDLNGQTLGDIKAAVPLAEAQVQLALAGMQASLAAQATADTQYLSQQNNTLALQQCNSFAGVQRDIANVDTNVDRQSTAIQQAIYKDGEATRELITRNRIADLEQQLTVSQLRESEQRAVTREQNNSHNMTVTVNQAQAQQQQQMQLLQWQLNQLCGGISQMARATNSTVQVGNTGAATAGAQTANPTNVVA